MGWNPETCRICGKIIWFWQRTKFNWLTELYPAHYKCWKKEEAVESDN